jgi:hypothetical protein
MRSAADRLSPVRSMMTASEWRRWKAVLSPSCGSGLTAWASRTRRAMYTSPTTNRTLGKSAMAYIPARPPTSKPFTGEPPTAGGDARR